MATMTLLEMTQNILSAMNSDEVNSITDTVESQQVAEEIKTAYLELFSNRDIPEHEALVDLEATGDPLRPNALIMPDGVERIKWVKYLNYRNSDPHYEEVKYLQPEEFVQRILERPFSDSNVVALVNFLDSSSVQYSIDAAKSPEYYTVFDKDRTLVFDSFDTSLESSLTGSHSIAWGIFSPTFEMNDDFVPQIDSNLFPFLLAEAKSACFVNVKEVSNSKEEQRARRQLVRSQFRLNKTNGQRIGVFSGTDFARKR